MSLSLVSERTVVLEDRAMIEALGRPPEGVRYVHWDEVTDGQFPMDTIRFVVMDRHRSPDERQLLSTLPAVEVVQSTSVGVEYLEGYVPIGATLCNPAPVISEQTAEHGVAMALAMLRRIPDYVRLQDTGRWDALILPRQPTVSRRNLTTLSGAKVAVLGVGTVGLALVRRFRALGAEVSGFGRSRRVIQCTEGTEGIEVRPASVLVPALADYDLVVGALPLTTDTLRFFDKDFFASMATGALFVNVGRGGSVDHNALVDAVTRGHIRAALDVVDPEPLADGDPLLGIPDLLVTPHVAGDNSTVVEDVRSFICAQVQAWQDGVEPQSVIKKPETP